MAPLTSSPTSLPGTFPLPTVTPPRSPRQPPREPILEGTGSGRGRRTSTSVQSRRSALSLGLGVQFAPLTDVATRATSPPVANGTTATSHDRASPSPSSSSRRHSRHSSISEGSVSFVAPNTSTPAPATRSGSSQSGSGGAPTAPSSRLPSRRPSLSHLASFLSGIEHHTRVRNPGINGGRGVSRSASRSQSRAGDSRRGYPSSRRGNTPGTEEDDSWDDESSVGDESEDGGFSSGGGRRRRTPSSRASSNAPQSRRSSISLGSPHPYLHSLVRENTSGGVAASSPTSTTAPGNESSGESTWEEGEPMLGRPIEPKSGSKMVDEDDESAWEPRTYKPLMTPRILSTEMEEEPFLDTAPSSPVPRPMPQRTRTHDSFSNGLEGVDVFEEGERVGVDVWLDGRGGWVRDCFADSSEGGPGNGIGGPKELEIERRLGEGTYAIVYLVREVLYDPDPNDEDVLSPIDAFTSFQFDTPTTSPGVGNGPNGGRPRMHSWASDPFSVPQQPTYGRNFALKCLCKKDLTQELIEVQRGEAVLHRALPDHEYIVRLYGAYETDDWLFLVLEYCPGRDLFYWLLESQQTGTDAMYDSRATSPNGAIAPVPAGGLNGQIAARRSLEFSHDEDDDSPLSRTITAHNALDLLDETPPSPSLLSAQADVGPLSRKRLRLISRMFGQMCAAVQACHDVGIAHRDIKPENFIVMDGRHEGESGTARVVVKITDWGLGTREIECEDFDCGSKPYMAYECRNNLHPSYDPRQADVWSLGLVLINLLYHRNPWADPSLDDPDFDDYVHDPKGFFKDRFEGIGDEVSTFLADRVFCDVLEKEKDGKYRRRVTAGEFGRWASRLVIMMAPETEAPLHVKRARAGSISDSKFEIVSGVPPRPSPLAAPPVTASLLSQHFASSPSPVSPSGLSAQLNGTRSSGFDDFPAGDHLAKVIEERETNPSTPSRAFSDDESLPSPSFSPRVSPVPAPAALPPLAPLSSSPPPPELLSSPISPPRPSLLDRQQDSTTSTMSGVSTDSAWEDADRTVRAAEGANEVNGGTDGAPGEGQKDRSKRRKRGARKGKTATRSSNTSPPTPSPLVGSSTPPNMLLAGHSSADPQDRLLEDLASASQNLARELSKAPPLRGYSSSRSQHSASGGRSIGTQSTSALQSSLSTNTTAPAIPEKKAAKSSGGVFGRFKNLVSEGNPDLEAFKQRAAERNAQIGQNSAPAKLQGRATPLSSRGSLGAGSWGSSWSGVDGGDEAPRGRDGAIDPTHWSSTSSRRERLDKQRRRGGGAESDFSPSSSSRNGASGLDSRNHTPLSSFSSVNSSTDPSSSSHQSHAGPGGAHSSVATSRDWRQTSKDRSYNNSSSRSRHHAKPGHSATSSSSSNHHNVTLAPSRPIGIGPGSGSDSGSNIYKPKLVDASTSTADLAPKSPAPSTASTVRLAPAPLPLPVAPTSSRASSSTTIEAAATPAPVPVVKNSKLAKMLSVFNNKTPGTTS